MSETSEQQSSSEKCPTCGTTRITFDPPLYFDAEEACGQVKPGNYSAQFADRMPVCDNRAGHEDDHFALMEYLERWSR